MSRMFKSITKTWDVFVGCLFDCSYCNARKAALTRFKHLARYKDGFKPHLVESELDRKFKPGEFIFVTYMGDIAFASIEEIYLILDRIKQFPETRFLIQTKCPAIFKGWGFLFPPNVYLGTTLETDKPHSFSEAPIPEVRAKWLAHFPHPHKFVSIEPIMDFEPKYFLYMIENIKPEIIEVGADNYHNHLPEPNPFKLDFLLTALRTICPTVIEKSGLERLKEGGLT